MNPWLVVIFSSLCTCTWRAYAQQGSIMVDSSGGTISTRVGCYQELQCTGVGTRITWRLFGVKVDLGNTTEHFVLMESEPVPGAPEGVSRWTSRLIFPSIPATSGSASYSCTVFNDLNIHDVPQLITLQLKISSEVISIDPPIQDKDVSSYYVGDPLLIGCPVQTCAQSVTVQIIFNDTVVATGMPSSTDEQVYTASIPVTLDTPGIYTCLVTADAPDGMATQSFNITGTPMVRVVPDPPTNNIPSGTGAMPTAQSITQMTTTKGQGVILTPSLTLSLILALGVWLFVYRL